MEEGEAEILEIPYNHTEGVAVTLAPRTSKSLRCQAPSGERVDVMVNVRARGR
jgi:hypothetical protein